MTERTFYTTAPIDIKALTQLQLAEMIEQYVPALFPEHAIDYWTARTGFDKAEDRPMPGYDDEGFAHAAVYNYSGGSEGRRLSVNLMLQDGTLFEINSAKSFDSPESLSQMAGAITELVESIYFYNEKPLIIDVFNALPKGNYTSVYVDNDKLVGATLERDTDSVSLLIGGESIYRYESPQEYSLIAITKDIEKLFKSRNVTLDIADIAVGPR